MSKIYQKNISELKTPVKRKLGGFTLIELFVVVLIIGILAAIALPQYQTAVTKSRMTELFVWCRTLKDAQERYLLATGSYTTDLTDLDVTLPESSNCMVNLADTNYVYCGRRGTGSQSYGAGMSFFLEQQNNPTYKNKHWCYAYDDNKAAEKACASFGGVFNRSCGDGKCKIYEF